MVANTSTIPAALLGFYRLGIRVRQLQILSEGSGGNAETDLTLAALQVYDAFFSLIGTAGLPVIVFDEGRKRSLAIRYLSQNEVDPIV